VPAVDPAYVTYLKSDAAYVTVTVAGSLAKWGDKAASSTIMSPLAFTSEAVAEAARQATFLAGPLVRDRHVVAGLQHDLVGKIVTIRGDRLGYTDAGVEVFVLGAVEANDGNTTELSVLKRL
jgi:hypothetical protein